MPIDRAALAYAVGNVSSSVALVLINKWVFSGGFRFPMTLTFFHFVFTDIFYRSLEAGGLFVRKSMPFADAFRCSSTQPRTAASPSHFTPTRTPHRAPPRSYPRLSRHQDGGDRRRLDRLHEHLAPPQLGRLLPDH